MRRVLQALLVASVLAGAIGVARPTPVQAQSFIYCSVLYEFIVNNGGEIWGWEEAILSGYWTVKFTVFGGGPWTATCFGGA
mgnify:CR=1 FL=1